MVRTPLLLACAVVALLIAPAFPFNPHAEATAPQQAPGLDANGDGKVVIALVDTGINPYHEDFRDADRTAHPSTYLNGFPENTDALDLTFLDRYDDAVEADADVWNDTERHRLYWIPGTKIVGTYSSDEWSSTGVLGGNYDTHPVLDDQGHGTSVASAAAGNTFGACPECLIVSVEGNVRGLEWAIDQPWIDIVSNSWHAGTIVPVNLPWPDYSDLTRRGAEQGKVILFAAGNGITNTGMLPDRDSTLTSSWTGPEWVVTVGSSTHDGYDYYWHHWPVDVISVGAGWPTASRDSVTGSTNFGGTSCATPIVAGSIGKALLEARNALGDTGTGPRDGNLVVPAENAVLPTEGPLADGVLERPELEDAIHRTAVIPDQPRVGNIYMMPWHPGYTLWTGWGFVNDTTAEDAAEVLLGTTPAPDRADAEPWMNAQNAIRRALWGRAAGSGGQALTEPTGTVARDPIVIDGDDDFTLENGVLAGSGTADDPYVIGGWDVHVARDHAIVIRNTDAHWLVAGNTLSSDYRVGGGVLAVNAGNGRVVGNHIQNFHAGVWVQGEGVNIERNVIRDVTNGVRIRDASPLIRENDFIAFSRAGVNVDLVPDPLANGDGPEGTLVDARYNYWGSSELPRYNTALGPAMIFPWYSDRGHQGMGPYGVVDAPTLP